MKVPIFKCNFPSFVSEVFKTSCFFVVVLDSFQCHSQLLETLSSSGKQCFMFNTSYLKEAYWDIA